MEIRLKIQMRIQIEDTYEESDDVEYDEDGNVIDNAQSLVRM